ncbi:type IV fimbrial biogenesis protein FimT [Methylomarinovum tepidoasis]|uniref:Type II secretion system protein H n=1 Tax=Methylomarinovum tepidoasis TaxID=2840183 RepID=A0AAU9C4U5_9GAMM|nr:GspH/FimT family pseudopilin [Methylomarinovum sp. IN45]BCX88542.1 type IV fimbrial biogenesis protein FimT [Methylomarinovum sp. IN45]
MFSRATGFTLIELMVTVAMAAIVLTVGVPSFQALVKNNRLTTAANELVGALNLARSEAIKRGVRVTVCKSADGASCATSGNWEQGWIVFTDEDNDAAYDSASETLLRVQEAIEGQLTMTGNTNVADYISYVASGRSQLTGGGFQAGTITICDDRSGNVGKDLVLSSTGKIRLDTGVSCP